jgi:dTDP-4-amino-4,6-dideoxygalactose transaminase
MLLPRPQDQLDFITHMNAAAIGCTFHYVPLNTTPFGMQLGGVAGSCPVAESAAARLVRLPLHADLADAEVDHILATARKWRPA